MKSLLSILCGVAAVVLVCCFVTTCQAESTPAAATGPSILQGAVLAQPAAVVGRRGRVWAAPAPVILQAAPVVLQAAPVIVRPAPVVIQAAPVVLQAVGNSTAYYRRGPVWLSQRGELVSYAGVFRGRPRVGFLPVYPAQVDAVKVR